MPRRVIRGALLCLLSAVGALAAFSPAAFAAGAPVITTGEPSEMNLTSGVLNGTINPNGSSTSYTIEYGKTKLYGKTTPKFTVSGSGETPVPFATEIFGLEAMSTYHYRVVATNASGTTTSSDALFETMIDWKVEGTRVTELPAAVKFQDNYKGLAGEGGGIELQGETLGNWVRIYCGQSSSVSGILGAEVAGTTFNNGCVTQINGVKNASCTPKAGIALPLDGAFAVSKTFTLELSSECPIGSKLPFKNGGLRVPSFAAGLPEATEQKMELWGTTYFSNQGSHPWLLFFSSEAGSKGTGVWKLTGADAGKKFGIG